MSSFPGRFVKLCGNEPALWHPNHLGGLLAATERIAAALDWPGFRAAKVKPLFDKFRAVYEEVVMTKVSESKLRWFEAMDAFLRPFVKGQYGETSTCSNSVREAEESVSNLEIDEDLPCDVCRSPISEDGNEMILCDSCNLCVHQACYGVKRIPKGDWFCRPCEVNIKPQCILCPNKGGAMKCTSDDQNWAHVSCALWIREVTIGNPELVEPIIISRIPVSRWNLVCSLCKQKTGACIQCVVNHCRVAFHATCAYNKGLKMEYEDVDADAVKLMSYCRKHSKKKKKKNPKYKKWTLKKRDPQSRSRITTPQKVRPPLQRNSDSEVVSSIDSNIESLDTDSTSNNSDYSIESNSFEANLCLATDTESSVGDENSESDLSSSTQNSVTIRTQIKREEQDGGFIRELRPISKNEEQLSKEEEKAKTRARLEPIHRKMSGETFSSNIISVENVSEIIDDICRSKHFNAKSKISLDNRFLSKEQTQFVVKEQIPYVDSSPEIIYEYSIKGGHTHSTFKQVKEEKQFTKDEVSQKRTPLEPIQKNAAGGTVSSNIISDRNVAKEINSIFGNRYSDAKTHDYRILSDKQKPFMKQQTPDGDSSLEILNEYSINGGHTYSTPKTQKKTCKKLESKMVEESTQSFINLTTVAQEATQSESELPTSKEDTWKIENLPSSTENEYLLAAEISHQASCSYDIPSTSNQETQESFVRYPSEAINGSTSRDPHTTSTKDEYQHLIEFISSTKSLLRRLTENKKHFRTKRKRADSTTNSEDSGSDVSTSDKNKSKRIRKESIQTNNAESASSERNEHYQQFAKVIVTVLKSIPPQIATTLEDKIITMCLKRHKQWKQIESKNR